MKLILTRHGETIENKKNISQGQLLPGKLSKLGIEQAKKLADRLKGEKFDVIYSSDLARASDTAKIIAEFHKKTPIYFVKELRERDLGRFAGKKKDLSKIYGDDPDLESKDSMRKRTKKILDKAYDKYPKGTVLFVGHGGINKSLIRVIMNKPNDFELDRQQNTAINIFEIKEDKNHVVHLMNDIRHLD